MFTIKYQMLTLFARNSSIYNDEDAIAKIPFFFLVNYCVVPRTVLDVPNIFVILIDYVHALSTFAVFFSAYL